MRSYDIAELVDFTLLTDGSMAIEPKRGPSPAAAWEDAMFKHLVSENERLQAENDRLREMLGMRPKRF